MQKRMTITMDEAVYEGLVRVVGRRKISAFLERLARPHVMGDDLSEGYRAMAQDQAREQDALAWSEALIGDASHEAR
ncbi:MAG: addiction module antitoxin [Comamonadaceae bacterium CG17_big_fil_post_rev_8_21_14_2_50_60_13]|nr:MAG: addiction module antitoxin [Comamonadaceae bacterium CG17_big_fil_post_rev_8_21_14_2_50_60_13]